MNNSIIDTLLERLSDKTEVTVKGEDEVSNDAVREVSYYLHHAHNVDWYDIRTAINNDIGREVVTKHGRFTKRISKHLKTVYNIKLSNEDVSNIGNIVNRYKSLDKTYYVDCVNQFDWQDGMFGHDGSCYWGEYSASRDTLEYYDAVCLRGYSSMYDRYGNSRVWIVRVPGQDAIALFNSYGLEMSEQSAIIRTIMPELSAKIAGVYNNSNYEDIPYINSKSSGTNGMVLWYTGDSEPDSDINIQMEAIYGEYYDECNDTFRCYNCNERVSSDYVTFVQDNAYCEDCANELFSYCEECNDYCDIEDVHEVRHNGHNTHMCEYHLRENGFAECDNCEEWHEEYIVTDDEGNTYCDSCAANNNVYRCEECEEYREDEPGYTDNHGNNYCKVCAVTMLDVTDEDGNIDETEFQTELNFRNSLQNNYHFFDVIDE